ncbi:MAG: tryptophan halogenase [Cellvibrio sp. 79]|nr:MAG: tryptophan halogenase [Cellvibrio sp. 79]
MKIKRIAIVGGGNAGWISANHLGLELSRDPEIEITLIESKDIPVIGVGEGTIPIIRDSLQSFGISEGDILTQCDATFKTGIKFSNWMAENTQRENNFYYHVFDSPYPGGYDATHYWLGNKAIADFSKLSTSYWISEKNRCPKRNDSPAYKGFVNYAYHFDAAKFATLLANNAKRKFGIKHIFETVEQVTMHADGSIKGLQYESGKYEEFDFYIDCSGFSALLLGEILAVPFVDKGAQVPTDSALVLQVPTEQNEQIFPYTKSVAHGAGWIWDIPLTTRRGTGFVYSSQHMTDDEAIGVFSKYHGKNLESSSVRKIPMKAGFRERFWEKNCVALGLAQGFVEPLEATSLFVTDFCAAMVAKKFPVNTEEIPIYAKSGNEIAQIIWARILDFIQLHYVISDRRDTQFWRDVTSNIATSDLLKERLELWKFSIPQRTDFASTFDFFNAENYLWVLYGMNYPTRAPVVNEQVGRIAEKIISGHIENASRFADSLISQRAWLTQLKEFAVKNK